MNFRFHHVGKPPLSADGRVFRPMIREDEAAASSGMAVESASAVAERAKRAAVEKMVLGRCVALQDRLASEATRIDETSQAKRALSRPTLAKPFSAKEEPASLGRGTPADVLDDIVHIATRGGRSLSSLGLQASSMPLEFTGVVAEESGSNAEDVMPEDEDEYYRNFGDGNGAETVPCPAPLTPCEGWVPMPAYLRKSIVDGARHSQAAQLSDSEASSDEQSLPPVMPSPEAAINDTKPECGVYLAASAASAVTSRASPTDSLKPAIESVQISSEEEDSPQSVGAAHSVAWSAAEVGAPKPSEPLGQVEMPAVGWREMGFGVLEPELDSLPPARRSAPHSGRSALKKPRTLRSCLQEEFAVFGVHWPGAARTLHPHLNV